MFSDFISRYIYTFTYLVPFCRLHEVNYIKKKTKRKWKSKRMESLLNEYKWFFFSLFMFYVHTIDESTKDHWKEKVEGK